MIHLDDYSLYSENDKTGIVLGRRLMELTPGKRLFYGRGEMARREIQQAFYPPYRPISQLAYLRNVRSKCRSECDFEKVQGKRILILLQRENQSFSD